MGRFYFHLYFPSLLHVKMRYKWFGCLDARCLDWCCRSWWDCEGQCDGERGVGLCNIQQDRAGRTKMSKRWLMDKRFDPDTTGVRCPSDVKRGWQKGRASAMWDSMLERGEQKPMVKLIGLTLQTHSLLLASGWIRTRNINSRQTYYANANVFARCKLHCILALVVHTYIDGKAASLVWWCSKTEYRWVTLHPK